MGDVVPPRHFSPVDELNENDPIFEPWQDWADHRPPWRRAGAAADEIRGLPEWWDTDAEVFEGAWLLTEARAMPRARGYAQCLARMLVLQVVVDCIRRRVRGEDIADAIGTVRAYLAALRPQRREARALRRVLASLLPFDPVVTADELVGLVWTARRAGQELSARSCALLAYDCARMCDHHEAAAAAANALADLAALQECPRARRIWHWRARVLASRGTRAVSLQHG